MDRFKELCCAKITMHLKTWHINLISPQEAWRSQWSYLSRVSGLLRPSNYWGRAINLVIFHYRALSPWEHFEKLGLNLGHLYPPVLGQTEASMPCPRPIKTTLLICLERIIFWGQNICLVQFAIMGYIYKTTIWIMNATYAAVCKSVPAGCHQRRFLTDTGTWGPFSELRYVTSLSGNCPFLLPSPLRKRIDKAPIQFLACLPKYMRAVENYTALWRLLGA